MGSDWQTVEPDSPAPNAPLYDQAARAAGGQSDESQFPYLACRGSSTMGMDTMDRPVRSFFFRLG